MKCGAAPSSINNRSNSSNLRSNRTTKPPSYRSCVARLRVRISLAEQLRDPLHRLRADIAALHQPDQFTIVPLRVTARADRFADARVQASGWSAVAHSLLSTTAG